MSYGVILIRILPDYRAEDFLAGNLYLNTSKYFGEIDGTDPVRFDQYDGIDQSLQVKELSIAKPNGDWVPIGGIQNPVVFRSHESENLNILCMYALTNQCNKAFDSRNLAFGNVAVIITNPIEFLRRVKSAAAALNKKSFYGPVEYVDKNTYHGAIGPFRKFADLDYQSEFRIVLTNGTGSACRLDVGDIRDIAVKSPSKDIPTLQQRVAWADAESPTLQRK